MSLPASSSALLQASCVSISRSFLQPSLVLSWASLLSLRKPGCTPDHFFRAQRQGQHQCLSRSFTTTPTLSKKGGKGGKLSPSSSQSSSSSTSGGNDSSVDPFDFTALHDSIADALNRLRNDLAKLQRGVRIQPEAIERLPVQLKYAGDPNAKGKGGKEKQTETVKVEDLATVVIKGGRTIVVMVGEESHVKPLLSALSSPPPPSSLLPASTSLSPSLSPINPLEITIPTPPPTRASRLALVETAKQVRDRASNMVRTARSETQKRLKDMGKRKEAGVDEVRRALGEMEGITERGQKGVKEGFEEGERRIMGEG